MTVRAIIDTTVCEWSLSKKPVTLIGSITTPIPEASSRFIGTSILLLGMILVLAVPVSGAAGIAPTESQQFDASSQTATASTIIVDPSGDGDYRHIQPALDDAQNGDTVEVRSGTYEGNLYIDANITLVAPNGATLAGSSNDGDGIIIAETAAPTVQGFTIRNFEAGVLALHRSGGDWTLEGLTIADNNWDAVRARGASGDWTIRNSTIENNAGRGIVAADTTGNWHIGGTTIRNNNGDPVYDSARGIGVHVVQSTGNWTIVDSVVAGHTEGTAAGLVASGSTGDWSIQNTEIANNGDGIVAFDTRGAFRVRQSTITDNADVGIDAIGADPTGDATRNWWGQASGPAHGQCIGHVLCSEHLSEPPESEETNAEPSGSVRITSPTTEDEFVRGDIVPIELEFENTDRGTLTFGDRDAHNVEINVTVRDTDEDGTGTVYLNTFQVGHGYLQDADHGTDPNFDSELDSSRNHGFFTLDESGTALVGERGQSAIAHPEMDITGGSQGGAVMHDYAYDLSAVTGEQPFSEVDQLDDRKQVNIQERDSTTGTLWTAPGAGVNTIDPETVDDIDTAKAEGRVTPTDGVIADGDFLIMEIEVEGMTGIFHEALSTEDTGGQSVEDLLNGNDDISDIWTSTTPLLDWEASLEASDMGGTADEEPFRIPLSQDQVLGDTDGDTPNVDRFYLPVRMESGADIVQTDDRELTAPQQLAARFTFDIEDGADNGLSDDFLGPMQQIHTSVEFQEPRATIDSSQVQLGAQEERLEVPQVENYTIPGITNVAAGSNLTVQTNSKSGQSSAFFDLQTRIYAQYEEGRTNQSWAVTNADDFASAKEGTEFEIKIRREGGAGNINPGEAIDGLVVSAPEVRSFEFTDQESLGETIRIDEIETNQDGYIVLTDENGTQLGQTGRLVGTVRRDNVTVALNETLATGEHNVTATVFDSDDTAYPEGQREAVINVTQGDFPALFEVSDLSPTAVEIDSPGEPIEVTATITNMGGHDGTQEIGLVVDGAPQYNETVTLAAGEEMQVNATLDTSSLVAGAVVSYSVYTQDSSIGGSVSVAASGDDTAGEDENTNDSESDVNEGDVQEENETGDTDGSAPGFGVAIGMLAVGLTLIVGRHLSSKGV